MRYFLKIKLKVVSLPTDVPNFDFMKTKDSVWKTLSSEYIFRRPWLTCTGTVGILGVCMVLHGIYNLLITADGFWQMVGYFFPSAIIVTLFAARLLHRGRHTVFR